MRHPTPPRLPNLDGQSPNDAMGCSENENAPCVRPQNTQMPRDVAGQSSNRAKVCGSGQYNGAISGQLALEDQAGALAAAGAIVVKVGTGGPGLFRGANLSPQANALLLLPLPLSSSASLLALIIKLVSSSPLVLFFFTVCQRVDSHPPANNYLLASLHCSV
jgi:hypothetical protein